MAEDNNTDECGEPCDKTLHYCVQTDQLVEHGVTLDASLLNQDEIKTDVGELRGEVQGLSKAVEVLNGTVGRIFKLQTDQGVRLHDGDKFFREIRDFMTKKTYTNGHTETGLQKVEADLKEVKSEISEIKEGIIYLKADREAEKKAQAKEEKKEEKKEDRSLDRKDKIIIGLLVGVVAPVAVMFIVFMIKTFIWRY